MASPTTRRRAGLASLAIALVGLMLGADVARAEDVLCLRGGPSRQITRALRFTPQNGIALRDRIAGKQGLTIDLKKTLGLCLPVNGTTGAAIDALESYGAKLSRTRPPQTKPTAETQRITNRFGSHELVVKGLEGVLVTTAALLDPPPAPASLPGPATDLACYAVARPTGSKAFAASGAPLTVASALGTWQLDVQTPTRLCFAADLAGSEPEAPFSPRALACYRAKLTRTKPPQGKPLPRLAATTNRFGSEQLALAAFVDLCVSSTVVGVSATPTPTPTAIVPTPTPTLTPPPNFTLRVNPAAATLVVGSSARFMATAVFTNGDMADFTERVRWHSSSPAALAPNEAGDRGRIDAVDGGAATISVVDEATGVTSSTTGEDCLLTIDWTLERIELLPVVITRGEGESFRLRATGHFTGGFTRSIAERLVYASSNPAVALPSNASDPAEHSRVVAVAEGTATLSATDPLSGITSTASGDDVAMAVVPPLERCTILQSGPITLAIAHEYQLTARGFYPGGYERNLTQQVVWASAEPAILEAPNTDGDRSRVRALTPGEVDVTATDSVTGVACEGSVPFLVGEPSGLSLIHVSPIWHSGRPIRRGRSWQLRAVQSFGTGPVQYQYVTEKVDFTSQDPAIVAAPNLAGNRGRVDAVGGGTTTVTATDPADGRVSNALTLRVLDGLTRIELPLRERDGGPRLLFPGYAHNVFAFGHFADGTAPLEATDLQVTTDNPAVVELLPGNTFLPWRIRGLAPGMANVSVVDTLTGISSDAFGGSLRVGVKGPLERLELLPAETQVRVGAVRQLTVIGHYGGGATELITFDDLVYASSAPEIAAVPYQYGQVHGIAAGTAVISATDPRSGVSSTDTGDDVTLTVIGPLTRLRVEPSQETRSVGRSFSFTAIGTDGAGREINVTQEVGWMSSNPAVAVAPNLDGNRSRIDTIAEGAVAISAVDSLDGVSSITSGDDATLTVSGILASITLSAETTTVTAGSIVQVTATGHLVGGGTINLTQHLTYSSNDPAVAVADNAPGDRSRILTQAPGTAIISAHDPGTGIDTDPNGTVTLVVTAP